MEDFISGKPIESINKSRGIRISFTPNLNRGPGVLSRGKLSIEPYPFGRKLTNISAFWACQINKFYWLIISMGGRKFLFLFWC